MKTITAKTAKELMEKLEAEGVKRVPNLEKYESPYLEYAEWSFTIWDWMLED